MDTEKKVQFVALTKEEIDAMIQQAALAGAQVASDAMMVGQRKSEKEKIDRRLHNTDLLLRNYRTLKASYENAVYKSKEGEVTEVLEDIMTMKDDKVIADNKTYALGIDNLDTLNEFLEELQGDLDIPGYDEEILQQMVADADEVTEKISEYGTLDESEIQKIKEANEKREQKAAAAEISDNNSENSSENPNTSDNQSSERQNTTETEPEITETRKFVICPNCGEKIWL